MDEDLIRDELTEEERVMWDNAVLLKNRCDNIGRWAYQYCEVVESLALSRRQLRECREMLRKHRWIRDWDEKGRGFEFCPECNNTREQGHRLDCVLTALLGKEAQDE